MTAAVFSFGAFISGGLNAHADDNNSAIVQYDNGNNHGQVNFFDRNKNMNIKTISYDGGVHDISEDVQKLKDAGYDLDNVPTSYDFSGRSVTYNLSQVDSIDKYNDQNEFRIFDRDGNYIETKYISSDYYSWGTNELKNQLSQEGYKTDYHSNIDFLEFENKSSVNDISVIAPKHILTLSYVDQNGKTIYVEKHAVTNFGKTDAARYLSDNYTIDNNQRFVDNSNVNYTVKVTTKNGIDDSVQQKENDIYSDFPSENKVSSSNDLTTQDGESYTYNANITIQDQTGKQLGSYVLSNSDSNIVSLEGVIDDYTTDYDTSKLPKYVDLNQGNQLFTVNSKNVQTNSDEANEPIGNDNKVVFKLIDQNNNFVEYITFNTNGKKLKTSTLENRLHQEKMIFANESDFMNEYIPDGTYNMDVHVIVPYRMDKVNYVNQDNQLIFSSYHLVSSRDKNIDLGSDLYYLPHGTFTYYDDNHYVDNKPDQTIFVTEDLKNTPYKRLNDLAQERGLMSHVTPVPINRLNNVDTGGISFLGYTAVIVLKNQYGKIVRADQIVTYDRNIAKFDYLSDENRADYDLSSLPKYIDISQGMQTFVIKSLKPDDTPVTPTKTSGQQVNQNVNKHNEKQSTGISKPTKSQLASITKSFNKDKHAVKADTAKLKALKKKMKKHATKKQKAAYKTLQTKLAADKKAVKSYKAQEGKLTKYFKEVSIINRDKKQIKSLTAQMKKLKKKHSKASKKQYSKDVKALKKANKSLKAATKFVNNYK